MFQSKAAVLQCWILVIHIAQMECLSSVWTPFSLVGELDDDNELNALTSFGNFTGEHVQSLAGKGEG